ncbi:hypothetical protein EHE19_006860 [Ruminiclostridium herbifermentans]|uniref:Uncharacterized protein n=1 Tax=Ruminiclostridium herbifermentans TaxID=2488810 RepID=A0A4U7JK88_9FIRM|nr:hypothetical protein [Ruminiclostridium herbifermentans]QNU68144.1 hypothetical protein EHE19_006860 [Ruminiclostridium herbifermentans]
MHSLRVRGCLKLVTALVIIVVLTVLNCTLIYADDTNLGRTPDGVFPLQENDVIMEAEEITVDLEKNSVECIFVFHNTGKKKNVYMGFPGQLGLKYENINAVDLKIRNFKTYIKGKEVPVTHEKSIKKDTLERLNMQDYNEFFTFTVPFEADERITIRNTYNFMPTYDSIGNVYSGYVLETGAMWKGTIGSAKVIFKLGNIKPYQIEKLNIGGFRFEGNTLVWERKDFEPKYNLQVTYNTYRYSPDFYLSSDETTKREAYLKKNSYDIVEQLARKNDTDELISLYNKAVHEYNSILALYIASFLPDNKIVKEDTNIDNIVVRKMNDYYAIECNIIGEEPLHTQLTISHTENGNTIEDFSESLMHSYSYYYRYFVPGTEYTITCKLIDWLDREKQKTIKFKVPEQEEALSENNAQPSDISAIESNEIERLDIQPGGPPIYSSSNDIENVALNDDTDISSDTSNKSNTENQTGIYIRIFIGMLMGIFLLGITVALVIKIRKKEQA